MTKWLAIPLVLAFCSTLHAERTWVWTKKDMKVLKVLEKRVSKVEGFHQIETEHWVVRTDVNQRFTAELALFLDQFSLAFNDLLKGLHSGSRVPRKPTAIIYNNKADYEKKFPDGSRGHYKYYYQNPKVWDEYHLYSFIQRPEERQFKSFYYPILIHEGTHLLLRNYLGILEVPTWFDEGVATFFQFWDLQASGKKNLKTRYTRSHNRDIVRRLFQQQPPALRDLFAVTEWNPDNMGPKAQRHYALGESFIDFMLSSKKGRQVFKRTFDRILAKKTLFTAKETRQLEVGWHKHIKKSLGLK